MPNCRTVETHIVDWDIQKQTMKGIQKCKGVETHSVARNVEKIKKIKDHQTGGFEILM